MSLLAERQAAFLTCLREGPDALPADQFVQPPERALLAMRAYANTVSHGRVSALIDTFPRLFAHIGEADFVSLALSFIENAPSFAGPPSDIGSRFPDFLHAADLPPAAVDLTRIDWAWLQSYRAAEAEPLALAHIAALDEPALLALPIHAHPALLLLALNAAPAPEAELDIDCRAVAIVRPQAEVTMLPLDADAHAIAAKIATAGTMGNLLDAALEQTGQVTAMQHIISLIGAGAMTGE